MFERSDACGARYMQFIPIVERDNETGFQEGDTVTNRSVDPTAWELAQGPLREAGRWHP